MVMKVKMRFKMLLIFRDGYGNGNEGDEDEVQDVP